MDDSEDSQKEEEPLKKNLKLKKNQEEKTKENNEKLPITKEYLTSLYSVII